MELTRAYEPAPPPRRMRLLDAATAAEWAGRLALGNKTFHRRFLQSTGMTFGKWRQQLQLMSSLTLLMQGTPITQVALASGYDSHSAYTAAFSKRFGLPPSAFAANRSKTAAQKRRG